MKRKICVVVASRANYGRVKSVMQAIQRHPKLTLQLVVGASTLLERFGKAIRIIKKDGFQPSRSIHYVIEGDTLATQAKSTGLGILELASAFEELRPDVVITVADRFETMATAIAATYMNIPLAHIQGGEVSGNIDDRVRHAITQLADIHFVATKKSRARVVGMGRPDKKVFLTGCPSVDICKFVSKSGKKIYIKQSKGVGASVNWNSPYILILQHPVTTSYGNGKSQIMETLHGVRSIKGIQKVVLWPNSDAGSDDVAKGIREFREKYSDKTFSYFKNFSPEQYAKILQKAACCVGNSSSFIREGSFFGTPVVLVGDRQNQRETANNCIKVSYNRKNIFRAVKKQLEQKQYSRKKLFGDGKAGLKIADLLARI